MSGSKADKRSRVSKNQGMQQRLNDDALCRPSAKLIWIWVLVVVVVSAVPYLHSLRGGFAQDDDFLIVRDPLAHSLANWTKAFSTEFLRGYFGPNPVYYRPLITISYQANYTLTGANPFYFRLTNLLLEVMVALLVFALAHRVTKNILAAGVAGVVFGAMSSHAESVSWISGRTDIVATGFLLGFLLVFDSIYRRERGFTWPAGIACSIIFMCGLLSKEFVLVLPVLAAAYVWLIKPEARKDWLKWAMLILIPVIIFFIARRNIVGAAVSNHLSFMLPQRILGMGMAYAAYLWILFVPHEPRIVYDVFPIGMRNPSIAAAAWLTIAGLLALTIWQRKTRPVISFCSFWILVALLPVCNLVPAPGLLPAERYAYAASVASSIALGVLISALLRLNVPSIRSLPLFVKAGLVVFVLVSMAYSTMGSFYYMSNLDCARRITQENPRLAPIRAVAGQFYAANGNFSEALREFKTSIRLAKNSPYADSIPSTEYMMGTTCAGNGDLVNAAIHFERSAKLSPKYWNAWRALGRANLRLGRYSEAIAAYKRGISLNPLGSRDKYDYALALLSAGSKKEALKQLNEVVSKNPDGKWGSLARARLAEIKP